MKLLCAEDCPFSLIGRQWVSRSVSAAMAQRAAVYEHRYVDRCVVRENGDGDKLEQERMQWLRGVLRENPELLEELTNVVLTEKKEVV